MTHKTNHPLSGQTIKIRKNSTHFQFSSFGGDDFIIEDWWDRVSGKS